MQDVQAHLQQIGPTTCHTTKHSCCEETRAPRNNVPYPHLLVRMAEGADVSAQQLPIHLGLHAGPVLAQPRTSGCHRRANAGVRAAITLQPTQSRPCPLSTDNVCFYQDRA